MPVLRSFFGQFPNQKLIKNKEIQLFVGTYDFAVTSVQTTQCEGFQQFLHADVTNLLESPACGIPKGTGDISLSISGIAMENNVVSLVHERAGSQLLHLRLVQLAIRVILNVFYLCTLVSETCVTYTFFQLTGLAFTPFSIDQLSQPLIKGHLLNTLWIGDLSSQFISHTRQFHCPQGCISCLVNHFTAPPFRLR